MTMYLHITIYSYFGTDGSKAQTLGFEFGHGLGSLPSFNSSALQNFSPFNHRLSYHTSQCKLFSHYRFVLPVWASIFLLREDLAEWPRMVLNSLLECQFPKEWIYKTMPKFIYVCMYVCVKFSIRNIYICQGLPGTELISWYVKQAVCNYDL